MKKAIVSPGIIEQFDQDIQDTNQAVSNVATVVTGNTNNSGHTISNGEYFIANGAKYKATATIGTGEAWATNAQSVSDHDLINALNNNLAFLQLVKVTIQNVTVPANGQVDVDLSSFIPSGKYIYNISTVRLGNYYLPYISGTTFTWVERIENANVLRIKNTATDWQNYDLRLVLFVAKE